MTVREVARVPELYIRWLTPADARAVARLERKLYPRSGRAGLDEIRFDLRRAQREDSNLSAGLFHRGRMVGCALAFARQDRRLAFEEFEVTTPEVDAPSGPGVYVEDMMLLPAWHRHMYRFASRWLRAVQYRHPDWPLDAFCRPELLRHWRRHGRVMRRAGLAYDRTVKITDLTAGEDWYWLSWNGTGFPDRYDNAVDGLPGDPIDVAELPDGFEARLVDSETHWLTLRGDWERLAAATPDCGAFGSFDINLLWWQHFGLPRDLLIVVLYTGGRVAGIAPLSVAPERYLGRFVASLQFIGDHSLMERPDLLVDPATPQARELLWRSVRALRPRWNAALLHEQATTASDHPLVAATGGSAFAVRQTPPQAAALVDCSRPWDTYLGGRSRALRRNFRRRLRQLQQAGALELVESRDEASAERCLQRYLHLEHRSWKHAARQGLASRPGYLAYYRDLCRAEARAGRLRFRFLTLDGQDIAATFGLLHHGHYASLEICHDAAFDDQSPGLVLTGLELERCHAAGDCRSFDFLSGTPNNKLGWATETRTTRDIYLLPRDLHGRTATFVMFHAKPGIKRLLDAVGLRAIAMSALERLKRRRG